jgi:hypothetical protein
MRNKRAADPGCPLRSHPGYLLDQILNKTAENDKKESPKKAGKKSKPNISEDTPEQMNRIKPTSG